MPFSPAILKGDTLYVSGQVGFVNGKRPDDFEEEVKAALESVGKTLHQAGYDFADVVAANVYLTDIGQIDEMNKVYVKYFPVPRPARATVGVQKLVSNARIEIMVTARK
jgi:2-iminobutanoate/2-iminopropanoate deaminase